MERSAAMDGEFVKELFIGLGISALTFLAIAIPLYWDEFISDTEDRDDG